MLPIFKVLRQQTMLSGNTRTKILFLLTLYCTLKGVELYMITDRTKYPGMYVREQKKYRYIGMEIRNQIQKSNSEIKMMPVFFFFFFGGEDGGGNDVCPRT